jgi:hypothetical protein
MIPYLITPPAALPVTLAEMKLHLLVDGTDRDADIIAKQAESVAMLDAWSGVLGRCIMPQTWAVDVEGPGPHVLPFPDVTTITATSGGDAIGVAFTRTALGHSVTIADALPGQAVTIQFVCGLSVQLLPAAQGVVKLMVKRDFDVLAGADYDAHTRSIQARISALRWRGA